MLACPTRFTRRTFLVSLAAAPVLRPALLPTGPDSLTDDFDRRDPRWNPVSGQWTWQNGHVEQLEEKREVAILELRQDLPAFLDVRVRLRLESGVTFRSAGVLFGYRDADNYWGVYLTSVSRETEPFGPKIQMFHRDAGKDRYPPARTSLPVANGTWYSLGVRLAPGRLEASVDGIQRLDFPLEELPGRRLALFAFDAHATFDRLDVRPA